MSASVPPLTRFRKNATPRVTLQALADEVGVSVSYLSRVERFGTDSLSLALKLSQATGLAPETFVQRAAA